MKTMSRPGAAVARGIALFTAVPLILSAVAPPGFGDTEDPVDDVVDVVAEEALPDADVEPEPIVEAPVESELLVEAPVETEAPVALEEPLTTMTVESEELVEELSQVADQHCDKHQGHPGKVEVPQGQTSADKTVEVDGIHVQVVVDGRTVSFYDADGNPISVTFCVKASTANSACRRARATRWTSSTRGTTTPTSATSSSTPWSRYHHHHQQPSPSSSPSSGSA